MSRIVDMLAEHGPRLPYPYSSAVGQSRHGHLRELRVQSSGRPIRVVYGFDPRRTAILLIAGHKTHPTHPTRFYDRFVPRAEAIYDRYVNELRRRGADSSRERSSK